MVVVVVLWKGSSRLRLPSSWGGWFQKKKEEVVAKQRFKV